MDSRRQDDSMLGGKGGGGGRANGWTEVELRSKVVGLHRVGLLAQSVGSVQVNATALCISRIYIAGTWLAQLRGSSKVNATAIQLETGITPQPWLLSDYAIGYAIQYTFTF